MTMRRNKRSLHQMQQTVKMKIAVIKQQKEDLVDILNDFTSSVLLEAEEALRQECGSQPQYQATLAKLDKVSQIFTNLASHIDSTLYADENDNVEAPVADAAGDAARSLQTGSNKTTIHQQHQDVCENSIHQWGESNESLSSYQTAYQHMSADQKSECEELTNVKPFIKLVDKQLCQDKECSEASEEKLSNDAFNTENLERQTCDYGEKRDLDFGQSSREMPSDSIDTASYSNLPDDFELMNHGSLMPRNNTSIAITHVSKKEKDGKSEENENGNNETLFQNLSFSQDFPSHSQPSDVTGNNFDTFKAESTSRKEAQYTSISQLSTLQGPPLTSSERYVEPSHFLPTNSNTSQTLFQQPAHRELLMQTERGELPSSFVLSTPTGWAQPPSNQVEALCIPACGIQRTVPLFNTMTPRYPASNFSFPQNGFQENANLFLGQNLFHQPQLFNTMQRTVPSRSGSVYNFYNNIAHLGQPLWYGARANLVPPINGLSASQFMPPRHGVLVQSPIITTAPPSPELNTQVPEMCRSNTNNGGNTSVLSHEDTANAPQMGYDLAFSQYKSNSSSDEKESVKFKQYSESSASVPDRIVTPTAYPPSQDEKFLSFNSVSQKGSAPEEEDQQNTAKNFSLRQEKSITDQGRVSRPIASDSSCVSAGSKLRSGDRLNHPSHMRKPKKLMDMPDDLRNVIKQALQEKEELLNGKATSAFTGESKEAEEPQVAQQSFKKDEINVVVISTVEDPWAFYAQTMFHIQDISEGIQEATEGGDLKNVTPKTDLFCLAKFTDGKFYRARIEQHFESGDYPPRIQVSYIDYGNKHWVSASDLLQLPENLAKHPAQAVLCALAKVAPAIDDWTEQATRLLRQLTQDGRVQMRVVCPQSKRQQSISSSSCVSPSNPGTADPNQPSPTTRSSLSFFDCPHLVDIISRQGKRGQAVSVSSAMVKAGHAQAIEIESQLEALAKLNAQSRDRRLHGLQKMMLNMGNIEAGDKSRAAGDTLTGLISGLRSHHKKIPACLQIKNIKGMRNKPFIHKLVNDEFLRRLDGLRKVKKGDPSDNIHTPESAKSPEGFMQSTELSLALSAEVDKKLRELGQAVQGTKNQSGSQCLKSSKTTNKRHNSGLDCSGEEKNEVDIEEINYEVTVVSAISPSSFFVHRVSEHGTLSWLVESLNKTFRSLSDQHLALMSDEFTPLKHTLCCAVFSEDRCYYRGLVLDVASDTVLTLFIDFGDFEWVPRRKLYPLSQELKAVPPVALWCSLKGLMPPGSDYPFSNDHSWSPEVINTFKALVTKNKLPRFHIVVSKSSLLRMKGQNFQCEPLEVYLVDQSDAGEENSLDDHEMDTIGEEICLNYELIHLGLAVVKPPPVIHVDAREEEEEPDLKNWNPLQEEFESNRNSYKINTDDPGVALVGYEAGKTRKGGQRVCVFYNRHRGCFKGDTCSDLHVKISPDALNHDLASVRVFDEDQSSLLPREGTLVIVTVATVQTPTNFYVTLPWGRLTAQQVLGQTEAWRRFQAEENLEGLMENMQIFYAHQHYDGDLTVPALGEAMAAQVKGRWIRAKVIGLDVEKGLVQVASVDFGWIVWVKEVELRGLELRFLHLAPQAVACGLAAVTTPSDHVHQWEDSACKHFADFVFGKCLVAYISEREPSGRLRLILYDTSGLEDLDINQAMVDAGLARRVSAGQRSQSPAQRDSASLSSDQTDTFSLAPA